MPAIVVKNGKVLVRDGKIVVADVAPGGTAPGGCCCGCRCYDMTLHADYFGNLSGGASWTTCGHTPEGIKRQCMLYRFQIMPEYEHLCGMYAFPYEWMMTPDCRYDYQHYLGEYSSTTFFKQSLEVIFCRYLRDGKWSEWECDASGLKLIPSMVETQCDLKAECSHNACISDPGPTCTAEEWSEDPEWCEEYEQSLADYCEDEYAFDRDWCAFIACVMSAPGVQAQAEIIQTNANALRGILVNIANNGPLSPEQFQNLYDNEIKDIYRALFDAYCEWNKEYEKSYESGECGYW